MSKLAVTLREHRSTVEETLEASTLFLTCLAKFKLIQAKHMLKFERIKDKAEKNRAVVAAVLDHCDSQDPDQFQQFLDALRKTGQYDLLSAITDIQAEVEAASSQQTQIDKEVHEIKQFLKTEAKDMNLPLENTFIVDNDKSSNQNIKIDSPTTNKNGEDTNITTNQNKKNNDKQTNRNKQDSNKTAYSNTPTGKLTPLTRGTMDKPQGKQPATNTGHQPTLSTPVISNKASGMRAKEGQSSLPKIENKSVVRLQSSKSDASSLSNDSDKEEPVINRAQFAHGPKRPNRRRRHKPAFLTSLDSSSSAGDLNASDIEYGTRPKPVLRPRSRSQELQRTPIEQDKLAVALQRAQNTSATALRQMDRCKDIIRELRQDRDDVVRRNEVLSARIENLSDHLSRMSQAQAKRVTQPKRTTAIQVSPIPEEIPGPSRQPTPSNRPIAVPPLKFSAGSPAPTPIFQTELNEPIRDEDEACVAILNDLLNDIRQRQTALHKDSDPPPKENYLTRTRRLKPETPTSLQSPRASVNNDLRSKIEELSKELQLYTHQEKQVTHKYNLSKLQTSNALTRRSDDQVEVQLHVVQKNMVRHRGNPAWDEVNQLVENTKQERDSCYKMMCDIEKHIKQRKRKLQDTSPELNTRKQRPYRQAYQKKQPLQTNLSKKMIKLQNEIKHYIDLEKSMVQRYRVEVEQSSRAKEEALRRKERELKTIEHKLETAEKERDMAKAKARALAQQVTEERTPSPDIETPEPETMEPPSFSNPYVMSSKNGPMLSPRAKGLFALKQNIKQKQQASTSSVRAPSV